VQIRGIVSDREGQQLGNIHEVARLRNVRQQAMLAARDYVLSWPLPSSRKDILIYHCCIHVADRQQSELA
jgi:hypothetical protein